MSRPTGCKSRPAVRIRSDETGKRDVERLQGELGIGKVKAAEPLKLDDLYWSAMDMSASRSDDGTMTGFLKHSGKLDEHGSARRRDDEDPLDEDRFNRSWLRPDDEALDDELRSWPHPEPDATRNRDGGVKRVQIVDDGLHRGRTMKAALHKRFGDRYEVWHSRNSANAVVMLGYIRTWSVIFLEHDPARSDWNPPAGGEDGRTVAKAIVRLKVKSPRYVIQSMNRWGAAEIKRIPGKRKAVLAPFPEVLDVIAALDSTPTTVTT